MTYSETIETTETHRVRLVQDPDAECPRADDEFACGALTLPSHDYIDVPNPGALAERGADLFARTYFGHHDGRYSTSEGVDIFERWIRVFHGGVTLYDTPYEGPAVVWYMTPEMMRARGFTGDAATDRERMAEIIKAERDDYRAWAEGDAWGIVVERKVEWQRTTATTLDDDDFMITWEEVDSMWGFIGHAYAETEARAMLASYTDEDDWREATDAEAAAYHAGHQLTPGLIYRESEHGVEVRNA